MKMKKFAAAAAASVMAAASADVSAQTIDMVVEGRTYAVTLNESEAAANLVKRLPMKLVWEDFGRLERIAKLSQTLDVGSDPVVKSPVRGTFAYYVPWGNLCAFRVGGNAPSKDLVELGAMDEAALSALVKSGSSEVLLQAR